MCRISDNLKLCSCEIPAENLKDFWVLHRFLKGKENYIIGEAMLPYGIRPDDNEFNEDLLGRLLNHGNVFDFAYIPIKKDRLQLSFTLNPRNSEPVWDSYVHYGFEYMKGKWRNIGFDTLEWEWRHEELSHGKIVQNNDHSVHPCPIYLNET